MTDMIPNLPSTRDGQQRLRCIRRNDEKYPQYADHTTWPASIYTVGSLMQTLVVANALNTYIKNTITIHTPDVEDFYYVDEEFRQ